MPVTEVVYVGRPAQRPPRHRSFRPLKHVRRSFKSMLAHLSTKSWGEAVLMGGIGFAAGRGLARAAQRSGLLSSVFDADTMSWGRAIVSGVGAYLLRNRAPWIAIGMGVNAVAEVVSATVDSTVDENVDVNSLNAPKPAPATTTTTTTTQPAPIPIQ